MYKGNSASLQRSYGVQHIAPQKGYIADDFIPTADNMDMAMCRSERSQLLLEKTRFEQELLAAKNRGSKGEIGALGLRLQATAGRLSLINKRIKHLNRTAHDEALCRAVREVLSEEERQRVYARQHEILEEMERTA